MDDKRDNSTSDPARDPAEADEQRVAERSRLLPEEQRVGSDDPEAQAAQILAEGDERTADRDAAPGSQVEHRTSEEATLRGD